MLYRAFPYAVGAAIDEAGGALFVPRFMQGRGRHDNPARYGALYLADSPTAAVAERLQQLRGHRLSDTDLVSATGRLALAEIDDAQLDELVDLDDPRALAARGLRPSRVATYDRDGTRAIALDIFEEGVLGFKWWSSLEAAWINRTLFVERVRDVLALASAPTALTTDHPAIRAACEFLGIGLGR